MLFSDIDFLGDVVIRLHMFVRRKAVPGDMEKEK